MQTLRPRFASLTTFMIALGLMASPAIAQTATVLHSFGGFISDGFSPLSGLVADSAGNLFGTTQGGGAANVGLVFELKKTSTGYTYAEVYSFKLNGSDGYNPWGNVILDSAGNLYGATEAGGVKDFGTVFEISPLSDGGWSETVLHSFSGADGEGPLAGLIFDKAGNLYGTTAWGGTNDDADCAGGSHTGCGTAFELIPHADGSWGEKVLHSFADNGTDGTYVTQSLIFDSKGNLYGTTQEGGANSWGIAFELSPSGSEWNETILHTFNNVATDGASPTGPFVLDSSGNLYGVCGKGGTGAGTVYELSPVSGGGWIYSILYFFQENGVDGTGPEGNLVFNSTGDLYGVTGDGGSTNNGTLFQLRPPSTSGWIESIVQNFDVRGFDPEYPNGGLLIDSAGNLYGTSVNGGIYGNNGTVWKITP
jgi:uncharacterized repeat protein (TIGR03803 family)